ncbi:9249_t:CDS:2 [Paraglomus occultum]|uniref:9249_t:CDS:1 n=1 Tax=Paraglomus occultum TaxID=144539 RepID=A0A9N8YV47_9GLOM|nr:9249_t:CDS:2 [Paraglomus occultum]
MTSARTQLRSISVSDKKLNLAICNALYREGFISSVTRGDHRGPANEFVSNTPENISTRRLWLELKYRQNEPVLKKMSCVSKERIEARLYECGKIAEAEKCCAEFGDGIRELTVNLSHGRYGLKE